MDKLKKLWSVEDIAKMTSLTTRTIRNYLKDGSLKGKKIGGQWRFTNEDIENFMDNDTVSTTLQNEAIQSVYDFIDGVNTDMVGKLQICTIVDLYGTAKEAEAKRDAILEIINNTKDEYSNFQFRSTTDDTETKSRFILYGSPEFLTKVFEVLK